MRRWLIRFVILAVVIGGLIGISIPIKTWVEKSQVPKYLTSAVSRGRVETVVNSTGTVKPVRTVSVGAFTSGPIATVNVDYNSVVKEDDVLAVIDDRLQRASVDAGQAAVDSQKADLERIKALLEQARNNEQRAIKLQEISKDYLSPTEMDNYHFTTLSFEAQYRLSQASIKQAEANLKNQKDQLGYTKVKCPADGVVIERKVDPGQTVAASFTTPEMFTIGLEMDKHMHIYASVDEADIGMVQTAWEQKRPVRFTVDACPDVLFEGHVHQIRLNATTTQNVVTYPVVIETDKPDPRLKPSMTANISFEIESKDDVLRIPAAALRYIPLPYQVREEDKHFLEVIPVSSSETAPKRSASEKVEQAKKRQHRHVWVKDGDKLRAIPVTLGLIDAQFAEILEGDLADGQALVIGTESLLAPR
jgi:HlyD family secretion protein